MGVVALVLAGFLIVVSLIHAGLKVLIAYDNSSGGAPMLDGYIFPPLLFSAGATVACHYFNIGVSGLFVAGVTFAALASAYQAAWWLGKRRNR